MQQANIKLAKIKINTSKTFIEALLFAAGRITRDVSEMERAEVADQNGR